jgi:elongation factor G
VDFTAEVERSLRVLDGAVALFCAVGGVQPQSEQVWRQSEKYGVPKLAFVNKMDRVGADFFGVLEEIQKLLGANAVPIVLPLGKEDDFVGIIDLISMSAVYYADADRGVTYHEEDIPAGRAEEARRWRANLLEKCAEQCDTLLEKFLTTGDLTREEILGIIREATIARRVIPVYAGSAFKNKGIQRLLDGIVDFLPSPADIPPITATRGEDQHVELPPAEDGPLAALAFKVAAEKHMGKLTFIRVYSGKIQTGEIVHNVNQANDQRIGRLYRMHANRQEAMDEARCGDIAAVVGLQKTRTGDTLCARDNPLMLETIEFPAPVMSISIAPLDRTESEKMMHALHSLSEQDPTFLVSYDEETRETILSGMGELHLDILVDRMKREFGVVGKIGQPEVAYRETATSSVEGEYRHVKQTGGRGQFAHVCLRLEPLDPGAGFEFVNEIRSGRIPAQFIPSVERGVIRAMERGPWAGYPVVDMRVTVFDGSWHEVDSSDFAFAEAARAGFRQLFLESRPELLEPIMFIEVVTPDEFMGPVTASICQRRGRIDAMDEQGDQKVIRAFVPLSEMFGYANVVRTLTQGRAGFTMHFEHYETVPFALAEEIIRKRREAKLIR